MHPRASLSFSSQGSSSTVSPSQAIQTSVPSVPQADNDELWSLSSAKTLVDCFLQEPRYQFDFNRQAALLTMFNTRSEILIFPSSTALQTYKFCKKYAKVYPERVHYFQSQGLGSPVLVKSSPKPSLNIFSRPKTNVPCITIYKYIQPPLPNQKEANMDKHEYVKVYEKPVNDKACTAFTLAFTPDPLSPENNFQITMLSHHSKNYIDCMVKGTKLRIMERKTKNRATNISKSLVKALVLDDEMEILNDYYSENLPETGTGKGKKQDSGSISPDCHLMNDYAYIDSAPLRLFFSNFRRSPQSFKDIAQYTSSTLDFSAEIPEEETITILENSGRTADSVAHEQFEARRRTKTSFPSSVAAENAFLLPDSPSFYDTFLSFSQNENSLILSCILMVAKEQKMKQKCTGSKRREALVSSCDSTETNYTGQLGLGHLVT
ncbi:hypothetical protein BABINDRAFT_168298 [Babjeviella inositovora NRRL Y-12698]|uniref:Uncharacterized protein n=1 Tax=Babjeviella inositovora NRRL Y-12698 TaxID=984486 RepID=A0A1E3QM87_9ASCO|nr:uncharacterized protein BABINDRAFT_168298 [Babjeviella inositovora NRRL Y-12698]ODQ78574.1 hypothetical protein BABINDRAFT_168298 [Babjeviella inositovora NRRL Y-12698]